MKPLNLLSSICLASAGFFGVMSLGHAAVCVNHVCSVTTTDGLIKAINEANLSPELDTIILQAGDYNLGVDNETDETGINSLPLITSEITIKGAGESLTKLHGGRTFYISNDGDLRLHNLAVFGIGYSLGSFEYGVIYNDGGRLEIAHVSISGGSTGEKGGGIYNDGQLNISHSKIFGNTANCGAGISNGGGWSGSPGAGMGDGDLEVTISDTVIYSNNLYDGDCNGGAIYNRGKLTLLNSKILGNGAGGDANGRGGGIYNSGSMHIINTNINGNSQFYGGGIDNEGQLTLENSTLADSNGAIVGGAIYNTGGLTLINTTISGNRALWGSGIFNEGTVTLSSSTLTQNFDCPDCATGYQVGLADASGGIANQSGEFVIQNSIISDNTTGYFSGNTLVDKENNCGGSPLTPKGRNLDSDGSCNLSNALIRNPLLGPLQDNGGSTKTHALLAGSPAIDAGDDILCPHRDQRGAVRPQNGDNLGSAHCDIGAYEVGLLELEKVNINGGVQKIGRLLRLTPDEHSKAGSAFLPTPFALGVNTTFHSHFAFQIGGVRANNGRTDNDNGSDGLAFVIQNDPRGASAIGNTGEGLGFGINLTSGSPVSPISPSVAIEFDTFPMPFTDPDGNHIGLIFNGNVDQHQAMFSPGFFLNNGAPRYVWIEYVGITKRLKVFINTVDSKPATPAISKTLDLAAKLGKKAFFGFTAGTGARFNSHDILAWELDVGPDLNGDSCVDKADLTALLAIINGPNPKSLAYDLNGDAKVNIADSRKLVTLFSMPMGKTCQ